MAGVAHECRDGAKLFDRALHDTRDVIAPGHICSDCQSAAALSIDQRNRLFDLARGARRDRHRRALSREPLCDCATKTAPAARNDYNLVVQCSWHAALSAAARLTPVSPICL